MTLLTDEALAWVGHETVFEGDEITESEVQAFVFASEDLHPSYLGEREGQFAGVPAAAPPMLYYGVTRPYVALDDYAPDGTFGGHRPPIGVGQSMGGTLSVEWLRPLRVGDRLTGIRTLKSMEEKEGARRSFVLITYETIYRDQTGEEVIREHYDQIAF